MAHVKKLLSLVSMICLIAMASLLVLCYRHPIPFSAAIVENNFKLNNGNQMTVIIQPIFTQAAYGKNGFYDYYFRKCDEKCLTVPIPKSYNGSYISGGEANNVLLREHYSYITDIDVDKNPDILKQFKKVILLHNEYVTRKEFEAIEKHPHVIYLYPNTLFAEVKVNYTKNAITLLRGHWYPTHKIVNGFDWIFDNTRYERDTSCNNWHLYDISNGKMLNCYPEYIIGKDMSLLRAIRDS